MKNRIDIVSKYLIHSDNAFKIVLINVLFRKNSNRGIIMKLHNGLDVQHLMKMLADALAKDQEKWKPIHYKSNTGQLVCSLFFNKDNHLKVNNNGGNTNNLCTYSEWLLLF